jgi:DNA-binding phage protein
MQRLGGDAVGALDRYVDDRNRREPGFTAAVEAELAGIRQFDDFVNAVLDRLTELGWSREELARRAELNAASLRRLLTSPSANPTFATMIAVAEALGLRIEVREETSVEAMLVA